MQYKKLFTFLFAAIPLLVAAQSNPGNAVYSRLPVRILFGNQSVGFPYQNLSSAFRPAFAIGTEFRYNKNPKHRLFQTAGISYSSSEEIGNKAILGTEFGYRFTHQTGLFADISLGLGIVSQSHPRAIYQYNSATGEYDSTKDKGTGGMALINGMSLGYDFSKKGKYPLSVFLKNSIFIQSPYFAVKSFTIMPHSFTQIGLSLKIKKHEK
jgi:hypothetical protein